MRIINRHITKSLLGTLLLAMGVLVFVMLSAHFFRAFSFLAAGGRPAVFARLLLLLLPEILRYVLPLSLLVATVLVFSRMSADNEITALKASGVSLWQIVAPGLLLAIIFCGLCTWLSLWVAPPLRNASEQLRYEPMAINPLTLLESGLASSLSKSSNLSVRFGQSEANGLLRNIHLTQSGEHGEVLWDITAATGIISTIPGTNTAALVLNDFTIAEIPLAEETAKSRRQREVPLPGFYSASSITIPLDFGNAEETRTLKRKLKTMPLGMLLGDLAWSTSSQNPDQKERERAGTRHWLELQKRLALSFSPLAFLLLGIPFGIRNRRSETTSGLLVCLVLALGFYLFMLWADGMANRPQFHPEIIIWIPNLLYEIGGLVALARLSRH